MNRAAVEKAAALGLAVLVLAGIAWGLAAAYRQYDEDIEPATIRTQRAAARTAGPASDADLLIMEWGPGAPVYVPGQNAALAGAELHSLIRRIFARHGGQLEQVENLAPQTDGPLERVSLSFAGTTDIAGLAGLIGGLEAGSPLVFIDTLMVRKRPPNLRDADLIDRLDVTVVLHGYRYRDGGQTGGGE